MATNSNEKNTLKNFSSLKYLPRFFSMIWETSPALFIGNVSSRLVKSIVPIAMLWVGKIIIDEVVGLYNGDILSQDRLWFYVGVEFALALASDLINRLITLTDALLGDLYSNQSSVDLIQKSAQMDLAQLEDPEFYDKLERARRQTVRRVALMSNVLSQIQDLITVTSLIVGLVVFEPLLILLLVVSIVPSFINELKFSQEKYALISRWTPERRELDYYRYIGASDVTAKEIKLFGLADFISGRFAYLADKYYKQNKDINIRRSMYGALFHIIGDLAYYGAYIFILLRVVSGLITVGELTFLAGSFQRLRNQIQALFTRLSKITESAMYLKDYFDFIDMERKEADTFEKLPIPDSIHSDIVFDEVTFTYPGGKKPVLDGLSFTLKKGEKLALVGENGAGKTTLIKVLLRLYEPSSGRILIDGVDVRHYDKAAYQTKFGAIFQDFVKYYISASDNIAIGNIKEVENRPKIEHSAEQSLAIEVIRDLPEGYDQILGKRFQKGTELSGGQWQKIGLARAYMSDSDVIILDEPTSALDARAEYEVFQRFIGLTKGKTSIIISHRFSTVRMADRILVLKDGKILELGTHEELMAAQKLYAELFNLQAEGYQ
jgi:ATP-binding cassette subfamily B protein